MEREESARRRKAEEDEPARIEEAARIEASTKEKKSAEARVAAQKEATRLKALANPVKQGPCTRRSYAGMGGKALRVFLSSTFRDMNDEREILLKKYIPGLRQMLSEQHI